MIKLIDKTQRTRFSLIFLITGLFISCFTLLRVALFVFSWNEVNHSVFEYLYIFGQGLIYDLAFVGYFYIPFVIFLLILPLKWIESRFFKFIAQGTVFLIWYGIYFCMVAEWFFWKEFGVRFNFIAVDYLVYRREVTDNIIQSYPVFWILPILFIFTALSYYCFRSRIQSGLSVKDNFLQRIVIAVSLLLIPCCAALFLNQAQRNSSENNYTNELASNGPYQLFAAFRNNTLDFRRFYKTGNDEVLSRLLKEQVVENACQKIHHGLYDIGRTIEDRKTPRQLNVILITVESLSAKFLTRFGEQRNITPFMDEWFKKGMLFTNFYATGTRTVRGLEAITLSIPPTPGRSVIKRPDNDHMFSLGKVFRNNGYDTAFLYGGRGYFDNMNAFFSGNGYRIVDQTMLSSREVSFKNAWGVSDQDLFNRVLQEAGKVYAQSRPFFFHIMTTSNHQPFTFPEGKIDLKPGEGKGGSGRAGGVKYTDYALSRLISKARQQPWFKQTVFVVVADHFAASAGKIGLPVKKYHIPLFIFGPGIKACEIDRLASQIDLGPTLLSLLHFSYQSFFFGKNILGPDFRERALIANYQKLGILEKNKKLLILAPQKEISFIDMKSEQPSIKKVGTAFPFVNELMAYYQGADYVLRHRMNRWQNPDIHLAAN